MSRDPFSRTTKRRGVTRRELGLVAVALPLLHCAGSETEPAMNDLEVAADWSELEDELRALFDRSGAAGFSVGVLIDGELVWSAGFGAADLASGRERTAHTLQNIGSVTKTATATLILRLVEQGLLDLDRGVQEQVDFAVRNPRFPDVEVTARQLLTHRSSILDGSAYEESYACGDRTEDLGTFLAAYFGTSEPQSVFHEWSPGTENPPEDPRAYSNVAYGLLGHLAEKATGKPYEEALRDEVLEPLGMKHSAVRLADLDPGAGPELAHASLYSRVPEDQDLSDTSGLLLADPPWPAELAVGELAQHCLYSFGTPPDGLLRSNVGDLAQLLRLYIGRGEVDGVRLLQEETVIDALTPKHFGRALCWDLSNIEEGENFWNHSGGDPGVSTLIAFRPEQRSGFILLFNDSDPGEAFGAMIQMVIGALNERG